MCSPSSFKTLTDLLDYFREESTCHDYLASVIWPEGKPTCRFCNCQKIYITACRSKSRFRKGIPDYQCSSCKKKFSVTAGTIFHGTKIPLRHWFGTMYLLHFHKKGVSSTTIAKHLGITQKSAWFMLHRIRQVCTEESTDKMTGVIQIDETFVGGKNKNRHKDKKVKRTGKGRDWNDKIPVVGLIDETGYVRTIVTENTQQQTLHDIVFKNVEKGSTIVTDDYSSYYGLEFSYMKISVKHHVWYGEREKPFTTNSIEGYWAKIKRSMIGVYNYVDPKHLQRYCNEISFRNNAGKLNAEHALIHYLKNSQRRLSYEMLIGKTSNPLYLLNPDTIKEEKTGYEFLDDINIDSL